MLCSSAMEVIEMKSAASEVRSPAVSCITHVWTKPILLSQLRTKKMSTRHESPWASRRPGTVPHSPTPVATKTVDKRAARGLGWGIGTAGRGAESVGGGDDVVVNQGEQKRTVEKSHLGVP